MPDTTDPQTTRAVPHVYVVREIRDGVSRRTHGYFASLKGAFAYCETEERKKPLIDGARFDLFAVPGGSQWLIHCFYGPDDRTPETSDFVISRHEVIPAEPAAPSAPADRSGLRERIAEALYAHNHPGWAIRYAELDRDEQETYLARASAVLAVLPPPADRPAVLREAADRFDAHAAQLANVSDDPAAPVAKVGIRAATEWRVGAALLRRLADEAQYGDDCEMAASFRRDGFGEDEIADMLRRGGGEEQQAETQAPDVDPVYDPRAWETYRRDAGCGCTAPAPVDCKIPHGTGAWLCTCHRLAGPPLGDREDRGTFLTSEDEALRRHFQEPNRCLSTDGIFRCSRPTGHPGGHRTGCTFWGRRAGDAAPPAVVAEPGKEG